ncbi:MAG: hypothetical protein HIU84_00040 [Acidobacteria bacterium]|nr:hypothetical protein [Acidobacteriota bacterium]
MIIALLTIPFAILAIAIAVIPLVIGLRYERAYEALATSVESPTGDAALVASPKLELAA